MSTLVDSAEICQTKNCPISALKGRFTHVTPFLSCSFPRVLKAMAQPTRSIHMTSAEERGSWQTCKILLVRHNVVRKFNTVVKLLDSVD